MVNFDYISIIVNSTILLKRIITSYHLFQNLKTNYLELNSLQPWTYQKYITLFELKKDINRKLCLKSNLDTLNT